MISSRLSDDTARVSTARLVEANLPLVGHLVRRVTGTLPRQIGTDGLSSAALAGLVLAAETYRGDDLGAFAAFATRRVKAALCEELRTMDWANRSAPIAGRNLDAVAQQLHGALGRPATTAELAAATGLTLDELEHDGTGALPLELAHLDRAVAELPADLRRIITAHFYEQRTFPEIAAELGVTTARVAELRTAALRRLNAAAAAVPAVAAVRLTGEYGAVRSAAC